MSSVSLSNSMAIKIQQHFFGWDGLGGGSISSFMQSDAGFLSSCLGSNTGVAVLYLMKGVVPVDFTGLTTISARSADILVSFNVTNNSNFTPNVVSDFTPTVTSSSPAVITTLYRAATASGTATWFWLVLPQINGAGTGVNTAGTIYQQAIGTVGLLGSGADLTMPDTNIISGQNYRIFELKIQLPTSWTY